MALIRLTHVSKNYGERIALNEVSLEFQPGEWVFVLGPSGAGKSTLLKILALAEKPSRGRVAVDPSATVESGTGTGEGTAGEKQQTPPAVPSPVTVPDSAASDGATASPAAAGENPQHAVTSTPAWLDEGSASPLPASPIPTPPATALPAPAPAPAPAPVPPAPASSAPPKKIPLRRVRRLVGVLGQEFRLLGDRNVYDNIAIACQISGMWDRAKIRERVGPLLDEMGIRGKETLYPKDLSAGEKQRVALARAMARQPKILIADEPTGNLDSVAAGQIFALLREISRRGTLVAVATHAEDWVRRHPGRAIRLERGIVRSDRPEGGA